ncbi:MAG TPA: 2,3-bisphosphoglycerate-dependent phosphoglycerate mutase [Cytophagaceae bacterium]|jgi:2,3-bisphosphoglycerate-dependent phosphoglycerate mutase|nr:2,3-bisphosphoglycerate-dependent phosphoglycerate mutase [Cytophagaceae bacterium]
MCTLIIVRHGQSVWNLENRFTGIFDVELSGQGEAEAKKAGQLLKEYSFELAYTSVLKRAIHTLDIILKETNRLTTPIIQTASFNERDYGDLQGLNKEDTALKYGEEQVLLWRRSYKNAPPHGESLEDTYKRVVPYYMEQIEPKLKAGKDILIVAHGNSLRALMMYLESISETEIAEVNLPTGLPRIYRLDNRLRLLEVFYATNKEE